MRNLESRISNLEKQIKREEDDDCVVIQLEDIEQRCRELAEASGMPYTYRPRTGEIRIKRSAIDRLQTRFTAQTSSDAELERMVSDPNSKQILRDFASEELSSRRAARYVPAQEVPPVEEAEGRGSVAPVQAVAEPPNQLLPEPPRPRALAIRVPSVGPGRS